MKRVLFYTTLLFAVLLCRTPTAEALTYGVTYYRQHLDQSGTGSPGDPLRLFINEVETTIGGTSGMASLLLTPGTAPTGSEGMFYADSSANVPMYHNGTEWLTIGLLDASSYDIDTAYNNGITATVDAGSIVLTATNAANNTILTLVQEDSSAASTLVITGSQATANAISIDIDAQSTGRDVEGTGALWYVSGAGIGTYAGLVVGGTDITLENSGVINNTTDNEIEFIENSEEFSFAFNGNTLTLATDTGIDTLEHGVVDDVNGVGNIYFDSAASQITLAANEAADDLTIQVTGAQNASLDLRSAGTGSDAIKVYASAGGLDVDTVADTIHIQNAATGDAEDITIALTGDTNSSIILASAGNAGNAIDIATSNANGDIKILSTDMIDIDAVDNVTVDISGAAANFDVYSALGSVSLDGGEAAADAVVIIASNAAGGIDVDAGTGGIAVDITGAADFKVDSSLGSVYLDGGEAAVDAIKLDASNAAGGVDIDAGTGGATVDSDGVVSIGGADDMDFTLTSGTDAEDMSITLGGTGDSSILISSIGTGADAISLDASAGVLKLDGDDGVDIDGGANGDVAITSTGKSVEISANEAATDAIDITASLGGITMASRNVASIWNHIPNGTTDDLTISVSPATALDSSLILSSAGSGTDALSLMTITNAGVIKVNSAGKIDMDAADDIDITLTTSTDAEDLTIKVDGDDDSSIILDSDGTGADAIKLTVDGGTSTGILLNSVSGTSVTEGSNPIQLLATAGGIGLESNANLAKAISLVSDGGTTSSIYIQSDTGIAASATTQTDASLQLVSDVGGIGLYSGLAGDDAVRIEAGGADAKITVQNILGTTASAATESDASIQLYSQVGGIGLHSKLNGADAIRLEEGGGTGGTINIHANTGNAVADGAASVNLLSDVGGIGLKATGLASANAIWAQAVAGGVNIDAAATYDVDIDGGQIFLTSAHNVADGIKIHSDSGASANINILNDECTGASAIGLTATAGGITAKVCDEKELKLGNADLDAYFIVAASNTAGSEDVRLKNTNGTDEASIELDSDAGGITLTGADTKDISAEAGQIVLTANHNTADTIKLHADAGASQEINLLNDEGTAEGAIDLTSTAGGVKISAAVAKDVDIDGGQVLITGSDSGADGMVLTASAGGIQILASGAADTEDILVTATGSSVFVTSTQGVADAIKLNASDAAGGITVAYGTSDMAITGTGASADFTLDADLFSIDGTGTSNISITANAVGEDFTVKQDGSVDASLILSSDGTSTTDAVIIDAIVGGIDIDSQESITLDIAGGVAADADIILTNTPGTDEAAIYLHAVAGGIKGVFADGKDFNFEGGQFLLTANHNTGTTIKLHADAGASQTIDLLNDEGTGAAAISLTATAGGVTIDSSTGTTFSDDPITNVGDISTDDIISDANDNVILSAVKMLVVSISVDDTPDTDFDYDNTQENKTEQGIRIAVLPAGSEIVSVYVLCTETVTGSGQFATEIGTTDEGAEIHSTSNCDTAADIISTAAAASPEIAATGSAINVWCNGTPTTNDWDEISAGSWDICIVYTDYGAALTQTGT